MNLPTTKTMDPQAVEMIKQANHLLELAEGEIEKENHDEATFLKYCEEAQVVIRSLVHLLNGGVNDITGEGIAAYLVMLKEMDIIHIRGI
jgi:hypothetical protein